MGSEKEKINVTLALGHRATAKEHIGPNGHTHDWTVFVEGHQNTQIHYFIEKVVFYIHESYSPNVIVRYKPPYELDNSGYAGFILRIAVHFKTEVPPKMEWPYDLFLHLKDLPPVCYTRLEQLSFTKPNKKFRNLLLAAGAKYESDVDQITSEPKLAIKPAKSVLKRKRPKVSLI